jgi:hypothetical protein
MYDKSEHDNKEILNITLDCHCIQYKSFITTLTQAPLNINITMFIVDQEVIY